MRPGLKQLDKRRRRSFGTRVLPQNGLLVQKLIDQTLRQALEI
jgi:hypothetical protein